MRHNDNEIGSRDSGFKVKGTCVVHPNALFQHLTEAQDLWQISVAAFQPREALLAEDVDLALFCCTGHVKRRQRVGQAVAALLGEAEDDDGKEGPARQTQVRMQQVTVWMELFR